MKLSLTIEVTYTANLVPETALRTVLDRAAMHLAGEGLLSGGTDAEVDTWTSITRRLD